ncbi:potassium channel family protein [Rhodococcus kronopolitis]|uniref:Potassium channel family protein n=1 Tax=Rhodococcus kronopolitis TaxID=1460226 RepID=A0ABV9FVS5_9NOCA
MPDRGDRPPGGTRLEQWEQRAEWPLALVALTFLTAYSVQVLAQPRAWTDLVLDVVVTASWVVFAGDYAVRLALAPERGRWFVRHLVDLAVVALPLLRPLRMLRLLVLVTALQRALGGAIRGRVVMYTISSAVLIIYVASLAMLESERGHPDAGITSFGEALWWAITTVTTVGYGDYAPVTTSGRIIAVLLMVGGISLIGVVTATVASWIVQRVAEEDDDNRAATAQQIESLRTEIADLHATVRALTAGPTARTGHGDLVEDPLGH